MQYYVILYHIDVIITMVQTKEELASVIVVCGTLDGSVTYLIKYILVEIYAHYLIENTDR